LKIYHLATLLDIRAIQRLPLFCCIRLVDENRFCLILKTQPPFVRIPSLESMLWSQFSAIFDNFLAKKLAFLSKTNVMIKFLHNLALFWVKNANFFAEFFGENILKIITSVPGGIRSHDPQLEAEANSMYVVMYMYFNVCAFFVSEIQKT
jgi:hypothetical protein